MREGWLKVWSIGGFDIIHSVETELDWFPEAEDLVDIASQRIMRKLAIEIIEIYDPIEDTIFHIMNESG